MDDVVKRDWGNGCMVEILSYHRKIKKTEVLKTTLRAGFIYTSDIFGKFLYG